MKKKGFSLIELLAVIVILAVIALITIPVVTNLIKNSKKEAFRISVEQVSDNIYFHYAKDWLVEGMNEDKIFDFDTNENVNLLTLNGKLPSSGTITITPQGKISVNVNDGVYCAVKTVDQDRIQVGSVVNGTCELTGEEVDTCPYAIGYTWDFDYISTGEDRSQEFSVPCNGNYKLEVWGAEGGSSSADPNSYIGGYGGYSTGEIELEKDTSIYLNIGEKGNNCRYNASADSYNGGSKCTGASDGKHYAAGGGGATHIALESGLLKTFENKIDKLIIVAGGGGGAYYHSNGIYGSGGSGGGYIGNTGTTGNPVRTPASGGTQTSGGVGHVNGSFGQGAFNGAGGGGGFYGGGATGGGGDEPYMISGAGGGSGYIGNNKLKNKYMYCYNCDTSTDESTYTITGKSVNDLAISSTAKQGNGYARITYLGKKQNTSIITCTKGMTWEFDYKSENGTGVEQSFTPSCTGYYKLEVWGAQGGSYSSYIGGYGGYSKGTLKLNKDVPIYLNVGEIGHSCRYSSSTDSYNGGAACGGGSDGYHYASGGGGATHIALESGELYTFENKQDKLLIVAGGGGGAYYHRNGIYGNGGAGGGFIGNTGTTGNPVRTPAEGGTQISGGVGNVNGSFGKGGKSTSGGGGGYYGGGATGGGGDEPYMISGAGGGSGYIGNNNLIKKEMYCYNCMNSVDSLTKTVSTSKVSNNPIERTAKTGNGYARITFVSKTLDLNDINEVGDSWGYEYKETSGNGIIQNFTAPVNGIYKLEVWGAQGGTYNSYTGGYGAYSVGNIELSSNQQLFIGVGGTGTCSSNSTNKGGFNGGGNAPSGNGYTTCSGGGATHIAFDSNLGELKNYSSNQDKIVIVAGGGGGSAYSRSGDYGLGGHAGGISGNKSTTNGSSSVYTTGGTQNSSGCFYTSVSSYNNICDGGFGFGANVLNLEGTYHGGAGGGGYYGGGAPVFDYSPGGGGGSSYIGNNLLINKHMYCYNCTTSPSTNINTYTISNGTNSCHNSIAQEDCAKQGNGYARITLLEIK